VFSLHVDTERGWRGGERQVFQLVTGLRAAGYRAVLVAPPDGALARRMREGHDLIPFGPRSDVDVAAAWRLSRILKQSPPDVIHAHDSHAVAMCATALAIASPSPRPPLIASRRSEFRVEHTSFSRWKYSQVDYFLVTSGTVADRLAGAGIARRQIAVVSPGVDVERIARTAAANVHAEFFLPTHAPIVGNVAALVPSKGHHDLIEAAARVIRDVPDARFVIAGDGDLRTPLERQIKEKHLERHIFLAGFRTDVVELTKGMDIYVSSAVHEAASMAILDAMAASKAVVAAEAGSVRELVVDGETGYVVPPRDPAALASRIVMLLRDDARRKRMGAAGSARTRARFTLERMVSETAEAYARALARLAA
jgi:glycosyltransferase involved in cell wall biosynthesis